MEVKSCGDSRKLIFRGEEKTNIFSIFEKSRKARNLEGLAGFCMEKIAGR